MDNLEHLTQQVIRVFKAKQTASFFLNGAPGSGKTSVLKHLAKELPEAFPKLAILGPYTVSVKNLSEMSRMIAEGLFTSRFVESFPVDGYPENLHHAWELLLPNLQVSRRQCFLIMIEITDPCTQCEVEQLGNFFSALRSLESRQINTDVGLYHFVTGFWDPSVIANHYQKIRLSFPYTLTENYGIWEGNTDAEALDFWKYTRTGAALRALLVEVTGGHLGALYEIYNHLSQTELTFQNLLDAVDKVALSGKTALQLISVWEQLSPESKAILVRLLNSRVVPSRAIDPLLQDVLCAAGITKIKRIDSQHFLELRSWFVERILVQHASRLELQRAVLTRNQPSELYPHLITLNQQAFQVLNDIETKARQFVNLRLLSLNKTEDHYLNHRLKETDRRTNTVNDGYTRALDWKQRNIQDNVHTTYNPLLTYCSTRDLANLIEEISREAGYKDWSQIADYLRKLAPIRDAVMHNQLIDDHSLEILFSLQEEIYVLLGGKS